MAGAAHPLMWASPRPLWHDRQIGEPRDERARAGRARPAILRFASDEFMEQLLGVLETDPARLDAHVARWESWRDAAGKNATADYVDRVPLPGAARKGRLAARFAAPAADAVPAPTAERTLKLYQPAHQRYYIATAALACAVPGLPDRLPAGPQERTGFVVRRMMRSAANGPLEEYGYVKDAAGGRWQRISEEASEGAGGLLAPGEEMLPAFPLAHRDASGLNRRLWAGYIPVGRREEYMGAAVDRTVRKLVDGQIDVLRGHGAGGAAGASGGRASKLGRMSELLVEVIEPWKALVQAAMKSAEQINADTGGTAASRQMQVRTRNLQYQTQSWLLLLDLMAWLDRHMTDVAGCIRGGGGGMLTGEKAALWTFLTAVPASATLTRLANGYRAAGVAEAARPAYAATLAEALAATERHGNPQKLDAVETLYTDTDGEDRALWPDFHHLLAGLSSNGNGGSVDVDGPFRMAASLGAGSAEDADVDAMLEPLSAPVSPVAGTPPPPLPTAFPADGLDRLATLIARALDTIVETKARPLPFAQQLAQNLAQNLVKAAGDGGLFQIRFVHLNEDCGPVHPPTLSAPTEPFEMANFFDSDAPARPVRITLPADTSPAGLRKHARGTAFVLSNMLCGQVQRAKGMGLIDLILQVLPFPLHKDIDPGKGGGCKNGNGLDIGMICSLSIPIITICAMILLMIIVSLLDFIFRWMPWFVFCFPVRGLKGKGGGT